MKAERADSSPPFVIDCGALYLGFEDDDGVICSYSYMDLKSLKYEPAFNREFIILNFPEGRLEIEGSNLKDLYGHFEKHELIRIRRGMSVAADKPSIRTIIFRQFNSE